MTTSSPTRLEGPWRAVLASARGASHQRTGQPNQDAIHQGGQPNEFLILAVADGHGSVRSARSDRGARFAVEVAVEVAESLLRQALTQALSTAQWSAWLKSQLMPRIVERWRQRVSEDLAAKPLEKEPPQRPEIVYGSTLVLAAVTALGTALVQLGDGDIVTVTLDGRANRPLPDDHRLIGNETTSLCSPDPVAETRVGWLNALSERPALLLLSTDGYSNSFENDAAFLTVATDLAAMIRTDGPAVVERGLQTWLEEAATHGSGDDVTAGLLFNPDLLAPPAPLLTTSTEVLPAPMASRWTSDKTEPLPGPPVPTVRPPTPRRWLLLSLSGIAMVFLGMALVWMVVPTSEPIEPDRPTEPVPAIQPTPASEEKNEKPVVLEKKPEPIGPTATLWLETSLPGEKLTQVVFHPSGRQLAVGTGKQAFRFRVDAQGGKLVGPGKVPGSSAMVFAGSESEDLIRADPVFVVVEGPHGPMDKNFAPTVIARRESNAVTFSGFEDGDIRWVQDTGPDRKLHDWLPRGHNAAITALLTMPQGRLLSVDQAGRTNVWALGNLQKLPRSTQLNREALRAAFAATGADWLLVAWDGELLWYLVGQDVLMGRPRAISGDDRLREICGLSLSGDGRLMATVHPAGVVRVWRLEPLPGWTDRTR